MKFAADALKQGRIMAEHPGVYCPVAHYDDNLIVMPEMFPVSSINHTASADAFRKLELLWSTPSLSYECMSRTEYFDYVESRCEVSWLREKLYRSWVAVKDVKGTFAASIHGDPTFENIVHDGDFAAFWIDPDWKPRPLEKELDLGKLLVAYLGYGDTCEAIRRAAAEFIDTHNTKRRLTRFYALTHIARMIPYQPKCREWLLDRADEL